MNAARLGRRPAEPTRFHPSATRWTLLELLLAVVLAAFAAKLAAAGFPAIATCGLVFLIGTRVAIVDYSVPGDVATWAVMVSGVFLMFFILLGMFSRLD